MNLLPKLFCCCYEYSKRTHATLVTLEYPRELLPFYSSVAFVPLTTYQSLRKLWNITIPLGGW